jgi:hypothetical protein
MRRTILSRFSTPRLHSAMRRTTQYRGLLVIVLWQAPVGPVPGPNGSIGLLFGGGLDQYVTEFGCSGPLQTASQQYRVGAVEFDHDLSGSVRVDAVAGAIRWEPQDVVHHSGASSGAFGQVNLRWDVDRWGLGAGILVLPNMNHNRDSYNGAYSAGHTAKPAAYARYGNSERLHARLDVTPPNALGTQVPARLGVGWNANRRDAASWFIGFAALGSSPEILGSGVAGEATLPVSARTSVRALTHFGTGFDKTVSGFAVGGRVALGTRAPAVSAAREDRR